jgi:hypothetical protein
VASARAKSSAAKLGQRRPPPQRKGLVQERDAAGLVLLAAGRSDPLLEAVDVQLAGLDQEHVAGDPGTHGVTGSTAGQRRAEPGHVGPQRSHGGRRRPIVPQPVDQVIDRHHLAGVHDQGRQQPALLAAAERQPAGAAADLQRSEDS